MELYSESDKMTIRIYDSLKQVLDPELGINIVDMGLVYSVILNQQEGIAIQMTLSSKGCPMGDAIISNVEQVLQEDFPEFKTKVELVWEPKWSSEFISNKGKEDLGYYE